MSTEEGKSWHNIFLKGRDAAYLASRDPAHPNWTNCRAWDDAGLEAVAKAAVERSRAALVDEIATIQRKIYEAELSSSREVARMATEALAKMIPMASEFVETNPCEEEEVVHDAQITLFHARAWITNWNTTAEQKAEVTE